MRTSKAASNLQQQNFCFAYYYFLLLYRFTSIPFFKDFLTLLQINKWIEWIQNGYNLDEIDTNWLKNGYKWIQLGYKWVQLGIKMGTTWINKDTTGIKLETAWIKMDTTWMKMDTTWIKMDTTWTKLDNNGYNMNKTV